MLKRVFEKPDGTVRIMTLNVKYKLADETDEEFCARTFPVEMSKDKTLQGLPFVDIDEKDIPTDRASRKQMSMSRLQVATVKE